MVKIELGKKDSVWIVALVVLIGVGFVYGYGGTSPSTMGHSGGEIFVDDAFCKQVTGHNCGVVDDEYCQQITGHDCGYDNGSSSPTIPIIPIHHQACNGDELWWFSSEDEPTQLIDSCSQGMCYEGKCSECLYGEVRPYPSLSNCFHSKKWSPAPPSNWYSCMWEDRAVYNGVVDGMFSFEGWDYHLGDKMVDNSYYVYYEICRQ